MYYSKEDKDLLTFLIGQETAKKRERDHRVGRNVLVIGCDEHFIICLHFQRSGAGEKEDIMAKASMDGFNYMVNYCEKLK